MNKPKLAILILNWNGWKDTIECLESVFRISYPNYQVVVIDNGSTDGSIEKIKAWAEGKQEALTPEATHPLYDLSHPPVKKPIPYIEYNRKEAEAGGNPELENSLMINSKTHLQTNPNNSLNPTTKYPLILIQTGANLGFAGGNNVGIRYALKRRFDYVLLLNNDTVVDKNFLLNMIIYNHRKVGIIGCKIYYYDNPYKIWYAGGSSKITLKIVPKVYGQGEIDQRKCNKIKYDKIKKISFVSGAVMLIKSDLFKNIGLLDESFFLGREDYDFCKRVVKEGYQLLYIPNAIVWHKVGKSKKGGQALVRLYLGYKTNIIYMKKWLPKPLWLLWLLLYSIYGLTVSSLYKSRKIEVNKKEHMYVIWLALKDGFKDEKVTELDIRKIKKCLKNLKQN